MFSHNHRTNSISPKFAIKHFMFFFLSFDRTTSTTTISSNTHHYVPIFLYHTSILVSSQSMQAQVILLHGHITIHNRTPPCFEKDLLVLPMLFHPCQMSVTLEFNENRTSLQLSDSRASLSRNWKVLLNL